jgi:hypothetical protein
MKMAALRNTPDIFLIVPIHELNAWQPIFVVFIGNFIYLHMRVGFLTGILVSGWSFAACTSHSDIGGEKPLAQTVEEKPVDTPMIKQSFDDQMAIFTELGYKLNPGITKEVILTRMTDSDKTMTDPEAEFANEPMALLYFYLGWTKTYDEYYTNDCIWYDLEFIDPSDEYVHVMKRLGSITHGEIIFTDIVLTVDEKKIEWISFKANGIYKKWKLLEEGYIDDSFFSRFTDLTKELKTKGRYTIWDNGRQQFVLDYATEEEQQRFIQKTGLKREWLGDGPQFSQPKD